MVIVGVANAGNAGETAGAAAISPQRRRVGQSGNPSALGDQIGDIGGSDKRSKIPESTGREGLAIAATEVSAHNCAARQIELFLPEIVVLIEVIAEQIQLAGKGRRTTPGEPTR